MIRNVGNVIPRTDLPGGTAASLEYAICVLEVENVIICGHTGCGAVDAILHPERTANRPFVTRWLAETDRVRRVIEDRYSHLGPAEQQIAATQENGLAQLENLREYRFVAERLEAGKLQLSGWVFEISSGQVYDYDPAVGEFIALGAR